MNIADVARSTEQDCIHLQRNIDHTPEGMAYMIDGCKLTAECTPAITTMIFYKDAGRYVVRFEKAVRYSGSNQAMAALCEGKPLFFPDMDMMMQFFHMLPAESEPQTREAARTTDEHDLDRVTDMSALSIPSGEAQSVLDYKIIQRELGKHVMGQEEALEAMAYQLALFGNKKVRKRPLSLYLYGDPGTGKSEAAKAIAPVMSKLGPHPYAVRWVDCNQLLEKDAINRVIGASQGFVGYEDEPILSCVAHSPYTCFIWDEADKCHMSITTLLMSILDEGRCSSKRELADHTHEYRFHDAIFIFTSNLRLNESPQKRIGFASVDEVESIRCEDNAVEVRYREEIPEDETAAITRRIYRQNESARKALVASGMLREIASRIGGFCHFKPLSDTAKVQILIKMVLEAASEYNVRLQFIAPEIMQALIDASMNAQALTVRSFRGVIDSCLAPIFARAGASADGQTIRLEGTLDAPKITAT